MHLSVENNMDCIVLIFQLLIRGSMAKNVKLSEIYAT